MLKKVVITNCFGECMEYAIDGVQAENPSGLIITSIDGLGPVKADINMMGLATTDGQLYNSAKLSGRNIVIKALFTHASSIEEARLLSYKYFPIKKKIKFHIETDNRIGEIEGYVESNEPDIFSERSGCQISILCENAYFDGGEVKYVFGENIPQFKFAFGNESLDERLIKMSEYATEKNTRTLIYDGDADTGIEMNLSFPTKNIMDSFKVTKIEVSKDGNKTMGLNLSKMSTLVPNTAPNNTPSDQCYYAYSNSSDSYKCLGILPERGNTKGAVCVVYNDELHVINDSKHYILSGKYLHFIDDVPYNIGTGCNAVVYHDRLHVLGGTGGTGTEHYSWNHNDGWRQEGSLPYRVFCENHCCVYDDKIHVFSGGNATSNFRNRCEWDGNRWTFYSDGIPLYFQMGGSVVVCNDHIHLLGCRDRNDYGDYHCVWDGHSNWISKPVDIMIDGKYVRLFDNGVAVVLNDEIHIFSEYYGYTGNVHFILRDMSSVTPRSSPIKNFVGGSGCVYNGHIYIFGGGLPADAITEEPNNVKLIENDQLIVNTIKGQKAVSLIRGANVYNVLNILDKNSKWFELKRGSNFFSYSAEGESKDDLTLTITANKLYEGV